LCIRDYRNDEAQKLARSARGALTHLLAMFRADDEARTLLRNHQPPAEVNSSEPASLTNIDLSSASPTTHTPTDLVPAGQRRGDLETTLRYLETFAEEATIVGNGG
jgi:hypothetical protein